MQEPEAAGHVHLHPGRGRNADVRFTCFSGFTQSGTLVHEAVLPIRVDLPLPGHFRDLTLERPSQTHIRLGLSNALSMH